LIDPAEGGAERLDADPGSMSLRSNCTGVERADERTDKAGDLVRRDI
jgi:hypothetical protein